MTPMQICQMLNVAGILLMVLGMLCAGTGVACAIRADIPLRNWIQKKPKPKPAPEIVTRYALIPDPRTQALQQMLKQAERDRHGWQDSTEGGWYIHAEQ